MNTNLNQIGGPASEEKSMTELPLADNNDPEKSSGLSPLDTLDLPPTLLRLVSFLSRHRRASLAEIEAGLKREREEIEKALSRLIAAGYVRELLDDDTCYYSVIYGGKPSRSARGLSDDIWSAVDLDD